MATDKVVAVVVDVNAPVGVPFGLQQLLPLSFVKIKQYFAVGAKYVVTTENEERIFKARQDISFGGMMIGSFDMDLYDEHDQSVAAFRLRPTFGSPKMEVLVGGELTSLIRKESTFFKPVLSIDDVNDQPVLRIKGPGCNWGCSIEIRFEVFALDKSFVGSITKCSSMTGPGSLHVEFPVLFGLLF